MQDVVAKVSFDRNYQEDSLQIGTRHPSAKQFFEQLKTELLEVAWPSNDRVAVSWGSMSLLNYEAGGAPYGEEYRIWIGIPLKATDTLQPHEVLSSLIGELQAAFDNGTNGYFNVETLTVDGHEHAASDLVSGQQAPGGP